MQRIQYDRGRLIWAAIFLGGCLLTFVPIFINPEMVSDMRRSRWLGYGFGRMVFLPAMIIACCIILWRAVYAVAVDPIALEFTDKYLRLSPFWGRRDVRWEDIARVSIAWYQKHPQVRVETRSPHRTIKVALGGTNLDPSRAYELVEAIYKKAGTRDVRSQASASNFDPDAVVERYLSKRAVEAVAASEAAAVAETVAPHRPSFGRKRA